MVLSKERQGEGLFSKTIKVWTRGSDGQPVHYSSASTNQVVGSPNNISIHITEEGYLVTWDPPSFGLDNLRGYVLKWYEGDDDLLTGSIETTNTSYLGK